jgi:hypothetical protein
MCCHTHHQPPPPGYCSSLCQSFRSPAPEPAFVLDLAAIIHDKIVMFHTQGCAQQLYCMRKMRVVCFVSVLRVPVCLCVLAFSRT